MAWGVQTFNTLPRTTVEAGLDDLGIRLSVYGVERMESLLQTGTGCPGRLPGTIIEDFQVGVALQLILRTVSQYQL